MFVAFSHNHRVHIDRIRMDGSLQHRTHVVEDLLGPHISLHYDEDLERVFWADAFTGAIESTDVEGEMGVQNVSGFQKQSLNSTRFESRGVGVGNSPL